MTATPAAPNPVGSFVALKHEGRRRSRALLPLGTLPGPASAPRSGCLVGPSSAVPAGHCLLGYAFLTNAAKRAKLGPLPSGTLALTMLTS